MARLQEGYFFDERYKLIRKLGEGAYSEVWLVDDTQLRMKWALKIFLPSAKLDDDSVNLFIEEFKLVHNINHPNLLKYDYFGICVGYPYLVMPYYCDGSAEEILGKCNEQRAWRFLQDVSAGLACLHRQNIVHQDIKPANVLLDGSDFVITDFGISARMSNMLDSVNGTRFVQGTRAYMPPEKFNASPQLSIENDIWSLGASLYELLTGRLPFGSSGGEGQVSEHAYLSFPAGISHELQNVVQRCLMKNPAYRPTAKELERIAANQLNPTYKPVPKPPPPPLPMPQPEKRILPWLMAAVGVIGIAVVAFVVWVIFSKEPEVKIPENPQNTVTIVQEDTSAQNKSEKPISPPQPSKHVTKYKVHNNEPNINNNNNNRRRKTIEENLVPHEQNQLLEGDQHQSSSNLMYE